jgi:hypothetical protein
MHLIQQLIHLETSWFNSYSFFDVWSWIKNVPRQGQDILNLAPRDHVDLQVLQVQVGLGLGFVDLDLDIYSSPVYINSSPSPSPAEKCPSPDLDLDLADPDNKCLKKRVKGRCRVLHRNTQRIDYYIWSKPPSSWATDRALKMMNCLLVGRFTPLLSIVSYKSSSRVPAKPSRPGPKLAGMTSGWQVLAWCHCFTRRNITCSKYHIDHGKAKSHLLRQRTGVWEPARGFCVDSSKSFS